ncbi:MAG: hypothetical protein Q8O41_00695, partial [Candidatus Methanoperedens sp.]|nr:hypothetical protein [Candidatus Methanoperedens sp.]
MELVETISTFDYGKFCTTIAHRIKAKILKTSVKCGACDNLIFVCGYFFWEWIFACSGWSGVVACC